jgi:hypothetical protein
MIREQMKKPQQVFANTDSLWAFYNFVTNALQTSHPKTWMEDQRILHYFIGTICDFSTPAIPNAPVVQLPDNQVVQEEVEIDTVLHQSEEEIEEVDEAEEDVLTEDELAHELYGVDNDIEVSIPGPCAAHDAETEEVLHQSKQIIPINDESYLEVIVEQVPFKNDEVITYTDPAGNTFEAPVIPDPNDTDADNEDIPQVPEPEPENDAFEYSADDFSLSASPADYEMLEAIESTEGAPAVADLDSIPVEKKDDLDFELNLTDDETEDDGNNIPDFF